MKGRYKKLQRVPQGIRRIGSSALANFLHEPNKFHRSCRAAGVIGEPACLCFARKKTLGVVGMSAIAHLTEEIEGKV